MGKASVPSCRSQAATTDPVISTNTSGFWLTAIRSPKKSFQSPWTSGSSSSTERISRVVCFAGWRCTTKGDWSIEVTNIYCKRYGLSWLQSGNINDKIRITQSDTTWPLSIALSFSSLLSSNTFRPFRSVLTFNRDRINLSEFIAPSDPCSVQLTWLTQLTVASPDLCFGCSDFAVGGSANLSTELGAVLSLYYVQTWQSIDNVPPLYRVNVNYIDNISNYVRFIYFMIIDLSILFVYDDELRYAVKNGEKRSLASDVESYSIHSLAMWANESSSNKIKSTYNDLIETIKRVVARVV